MPEAVNECPSEPPSRRSCLSVPATSESKLHKAAGLATDEVVIDLEDSVAASHKEDGLAGALAALSWWPASGPRVSVRVNPPRTSWCHLELAALAAAPGPLQAVVVPKVEDAGDIAFVERLLDGAETANGRHVTLRIQALIETACGLAKVGEIARSSSRLTSLILGYADLAASLGRPTSGTADLNLWLPAQDTVLIAARANDLQAIDGPFLRIDATDAFRAAASRARDLGFDGKWAIHPAQLDELNQLFTPSDEQIAHALAVLKRLASSEAHAGAGAVSLDGEMIDEAVRRSAMRLLARARR